MDRLALDIRDYLNATLGAHIVLRPPSHLRLPLFLSQRYHILEGSLFGTRLLFAVARKPEDQTPSDIRTQLTRLQEHGGSPVVYVRRGITSYNRRRLIDARVPFIVPRRQMFLPQLGLDLRERFGSLRRVGKALSPSAQAVLLHILLRPDALDPFTTATVAPPLRYSPITLSRAFDELSAADLAESATLGRTRQLRLREPAQPTWRKAQPLLRSPVGRIYHVRGAARILPGVIAGMSALARRSHLADPSTPVIAASRQEWKVAQGRRGLVVVPEPEPETVVVEVWHYPPRLLCNGKIADPLSLALSLREERDERVEAAIEHMLAAIPW